MLYSCTHVATVGVKGLKQTDATLHSIQRLLTYRLVRPVDYSVHFTRTFTAEERLTRKQLGYIRTSALALYALSFDLHFAGQQEHNCATHTSCSDTCRIIPTYS